jgi:hypothetical protein
MATLETALMHKIIPGYQLALRDLAVSESRVCLIDLVMTAGWIQGFAEHKGEEITEPYARLIDLLKIAASARTIEEALRLLVKVGEHLDMAFAESCATYQRTEATHTETIDPAALLSAKKLFID